MSASVEAKNGKWWSLIVIGLWQPQYNRVRPHTGLADMLKPQGFYTHLEHIFTKLGL